MTHAKEFNIFMLGISALQASSKLHSDPGATRSALALAFIFRAFGAPEILKLALGMLSQQISTGSDSDRVVGMLLTRAGVA